MSDMDDIDALVEPDDARIHGPGFSNHQIRLPRRVVRRFRKIFPMRGSMTWFIKACLVEVTRELADVPQQALARSVDKVLRDMTGIEEPRKRHFREGREDAFMD